jgi:hypothetical protein
MALPHTSVTDVFIMILRISMAACDGSIWTRLTSPCTPDDNEGSIDALVDSEVCCWEIATVNYATAEHWV